MFEKFKKKVVTNTTKAIKEEAIKNMDKQLPVIMGLVSIGVALFVGLNSTKITQQPVQHIVVNNIYVK